MAARLVAIVVISLFTMALWVPDVSRLLGHPLGTPGFKIGLGGQVVQVDAGSPAQRQGIRVGDSIDLPATPLHSRLLLINANFQNLHPLQQFPVRVQSGGREFTAVVASERESATDIDTVLPRIVFLLILLASGIALVLIRPNKATWGFFIFAAFSPGAPINLAIWLGPVPYQIAMTVLITTGWAVISQIGAVIFALYLLVKPPASPWRWRAEIAVYVIAALAILLQARSVISAVYSGVLLDGANAVIFGLEIVASVAPPVLLGITYMSSNASARERIRWVIFAFTINAFAYALLVVTSQSVMNTTVPYWLWATAAGIDTLVMAFTVLYSVLKHHIIDINVAISRALVYTILSTIIVGAFALVDLFFTTVISVKTVGLIADIALALVLGFFFNALHFRVDRFVDSVLFRQRHAAEEHLRTVIRGMPFAASQVQVDRLLTEEPCRSFALTGSLLVACSEDGRFELRHTFGTPPRGLTIASREDALAAYLQGERCALRLNKHGWDVAGIAIPVFSHSDLAGIVVYGLHQNGTDLDGEEIAFFEQVAAAAGNAYDRLEAQRLRDEVRELRLQRV